MTKVSFGRLLTVRFQRLKTTKCFTLKNPNHIREDFAFGTSFKCFFNSGCYYTPTENDNLLAIKDFALRVPVHLLVIPETFSLRLDDMSDAQGAGEVGALVEAAIKSARTNEKDYRLVVNVGPGAGQEVFHTYTYVHVMAGREQAAPLG